MNNEHSTRSLQSHQNVFISLACISVHEAYITILFSEIAEHDMTSHSSNSNSFVFWLLTFPAKHSPKRYYLISYACVSTHEWWFSYYWWVFAYCILVTGSNTLSYSWRMEIPNRQMRSISSWLGWWTRVAHDEVDGHVSNAFDGTCVHITWLNKVGHTGIQQKHQLWVIAR